MPRINDEIYFENVALTFCNFSGIEKPPYNAAGDRNFAVQIEDVDFAKKLADDGWNIKFPEPTEDGKVYPPTLTVKIKYHEDRPKLNPQIMMEQGGNKVYLTEETIDQLDILDIINVKALEVSPYNWEVRGATGTTAYLKKMRVEVARDMFCD